MMRALLHRWLLAASCVCISACDTGPRPEPIVIYASPALEQQLLELTAAFSDDTGIPVTLQLESSAVNSTRVINNEGSPPADILVTTNVADIWMAADEGALRPIVSENLARLPESMRDPDDTWIGIWPDSAVIAYSEAAADVPQSYADLAAPALKGKVCLSSSSRPLNRTLVAMLIDELGRRPAELLVRGWVFNRASLPFDTDEELLAALDTGPCEYGIVSGSAAAGRDRIVVPDVSYFDVQAVGIARHARYPESAQLFVDWIATNIAVTKPENASERNMAVAGWRAVDAELLAERASYR